MRASRSLRKLFYLLPLLIAPSFLPAQTHSFPATDTANTFSAPNTFQLGVQLGPVPFSSLAGLSANAGRYILCSDCQLVNPCVSGGPGAFAQRIGSVWNCASGGGGSSVSVNSGAVSTPNFNASSPSPDSGFAAGTFKVSGSNIILEVPQVTITTSSPLGGGGTLLPGGSLTLTCVGCGISGQTLGFVPVATGGSTFAPSPLDYNITNSGQFTSSVPLNFSGAGVATWQAASAACTTPTGTNIIVSLCGNALQVSIGTAGFNPVATQGNISGAWISSCCVTANFLNASYASGDVFFTQANSTGNTLAAVTAAADVGTAATSSGLCTDANGNATTINCPAGAGSADSFLSNVSGVTAFGSNLTFAASFGMISTSTNGNLILAPNGTGSVTIPAGTLANPGFAFTGDIPGNGFYQPTTGAWCYKSSTAKLCMKSSTGMILPSTLGYGFSSSADASGTPDTCLNRIGAGVFGLGTLCSTSNFLANLQLAKIVNYNGTATAGLGVPAIYGTPVDLVAQSATTTQTLITSVPANGFYRIGYSLSQNATCTSGSNSVALVLSWTDDANVSRTYTSPSLTLGTTNPASAHIKAVLPAFLKSASAVSSTITVTGTCTTGGSSFNFHADVFQTH